MSKRLSSILVPIYKLFPLIPLLMILWSIPNWVSRNFSKDVVPALLFLFIWGGFFYFATFRWKNVYLRYNTISISNFFKTVEIPISQVRFVEASSWWGWQPRTITMKLKTKTEFGEEIVFVPRGLGYSATESAEELKSLFKLK